MHRYFQEPINRPCAALSILACFMVLYSCGCGQSAPSNSALTTALAKPAAGGASQPVVLRKYHITPESLPAPYATPSAENGPHLIRQPAGAGLTVPKGFKISEWASRLENPRAMAVAPNGDVFVTESSPGRVVVLRATGHPDHPNPPMVFADKLSLPFGIAFYPPGPNPSYIYVANTDSVVRFPYKNGDLVSSGAPTTLLTLPGGGYHQHWTRRLVFSPDGKKMYVSVGSQENIGEEEERRAAILEFNPDGTGYQVFASGLRNAVGLNFSPVTGKLWAAINERDGLGDDLVPDYATSVVRGGFYGWPYYYIGKHHDPRMPEKPDLEARTLIPDVLFMSHTAALSVTFYTGNQFPKEYKNDAFVGLHGSWNRSARSGYSVVRIHMKPNGEPVAGYSDFVAGWLMPDEQVWGRPADIAVAHDGSLLITDDGEGKIWRVSYRGT